MPVKITLVARRLILLAVVPRLPVDRRLRVGFGVVDDVVEEGVGVKVEHRRVRVVEAEVRGDEGEPCVPVRDGEGWDGVFPFAREGHAVQGRDVEDEEVARAGVVEL